MNEAMEFLLALGPTERCLLAEVGDQGLAARDARELTGPELEGRIAELLEEVLVSGKALMAIDKINGELRSYLCLPLTDPQGQRIGILYADSRVSNGNFQHPDLGKAKEFAQEFEKLFFRRKEQSEPQEPAHSESSAQRPSLTRALAAIVLCSAAVLWVVVGFSAEISQAGAGPTPTPVAPPPKVLTLHDPVTASRFYLSLLRQGNFESAYSLLSGRLQSEISPQSYQTAIGQWLSEHPGLQREPYLLERGETLCRVEIRATESGSEAKSWVWSLRSEGQNGWKLDKFEGGPEIRS